MFGCPRSTWLNVDRVVVVRESFLVVWICIVECESTWVDSLGGDSIMFGCPRSTWLNVDRVVVVRESFLVVWICIVECESTWVDSLL